MKIKYMIVIFLVTLIFGLFFIKISFDVIWNFGFSYNIASGLIPYRDFNMVITPLFPMLIAIFLKLFGGQIIILYIINSIIVVSIYYLLKKIGNAKYYILFPLILLLSTPNYTLFCFFLLLLIIYCEINHKNDYLIGFLLALMVLTKQSVGVMILLPTLLLIRNMQLLKRFIGFIIPILIFLIYLLITKSLFQFIDYTILGLFDFADKNILISPLSYIEAIIVIYLIYKLIKNKNDIMLQYILFFQIVTYPIFDPYHFMIGFLAFLLYVINNLKLNERLIKLATIFLSILFLIGSILRFDYNNIEYLNHTKTMKYVAIDKEILNELDKISKYIERHHYNYNNIYLFNYWAYAIKLENNQKINKYDLINNGNLGYNGSEKLLTNTKAAKKGTIFIINIFEFASGQMNKEILYYITNNMTKIDNVDSFIIYQK